MNGSVVLASGVDSSRLLPAASVGALPALSVAVGVLAETAPASSVANACAPLSSCAGVGFASVTHAVTPARSYPWIVPRLQARL
jgi:hypothetical protein